MRAERKNKMHLSNALMTDLIPQRRKRTPTRSRVHRLMESAAADVQVGAARQVKGIGC